MSSHHFVKEDQEPALMICEPEFNVDLLFQLLEWSPRVIAFGKAVEQLVLLGVKIDIVICRESNYPGLMNSLRYQLPVEFIKIKANTFKAGIRWFATTNYAAINIFNHCKISMLKTFSSGLHKDIVVWSGNVKWSYCHSGLFKKWVDKGHSFTFPDKGPELSILPGLMKREVKGHEVHQANQSGLVTISSASPFWLGEIIH